MTREDPAELLPPELLDGLDDLEWAAGMVARSLAHGIHPSVFVGRGEEFERHRPYQQGDDLRHLDWRLLARTDRLHVRRFREASSLPTIFVVDRSPSMAFSGDGGQVTKLRYAALVVAALGHVARNAGDVPGLVVGGGPGGQPTTVLPPRPGRERWRAILHALDALEAGAPGPLSATLEVAADLLPRGGRVVVVSDFLDEEADEVARVAASLRARGDDVTAIRVLTPEELGEAGGGDALWTDPERPDRALPGSPARDAGYLDRLHAHYRELVDALAAHGVRWHEARTTDPLVPLVRGWLRAPPRGAAR